MPAAPETMTAQQKAWMASIRDNLVRETAGTAAVAPLIRQAWEAS